ncbi:hypothetical protein YTPLAS18_26990 [Nitrospira sp.]|nr:hypothetical protein YTPLAS18_26990 [Nitrospira sp.]
MIRDVTGHGAFLAAGGRAEDGKPRQPKEQVAEPSQDTTAASASVEGRTTSAEGSPGKGIQLNGNELHYEVDQELNEVVMKILDGNTGDVIRQIPAEEQIRLAKVLEEASGTLLSKHV